MSDEIHIAIGEDGVGRSVTLIPFLGGPLDGMEGVYGGGEEPATKISLQAQNVPPQFRERFPNGHVASYKLKPDAEADLHYVWDGWSKLVANIEMPKGPE